MFKEEFKDKNFSALKQVCVDSGFQGIKDYVEHNNNIKIPKKNSKKHPLTDEEKETNRIISINRIGVENAIGGIKRYFILRTESRSHTNDTKDEEMYLCTALWNFKIKDKISI